MRTISHNVSQLRDCYGCGICAIICPKNIITVKLNQDGFYQPQLCDDHSCTQCGLCLSVCAYSSDTLLDLDNCNVTGYAAWSNDRLIRSKCSSGGLSFELGAHLIKLGYKACGVKYDPTVGRAEHFIATDVETYASSIGSKYIQSYTIPGFSQLNRNDKFFVTGTPCQIDSLRRYIRRYKIEHNYVLMDFFCHGVPSMNLWRKYTAMVSDQIGRISFASWRNKQAGWHNSWVMGIDGARKAAPQNWDADAPHLESKAGSHEYLSPKSNGDLFYSFFLDNTCLGKACYDKCKYKIDRSAADIRVGDLWGKKYKMNAEGVSGVLVFTDRGRAVVAQLTGCTIFEEDVSAVVDGQMELPPHLPLARRYLLKLFTTHLTLKATYRLYQWYLLPARLFNRALITARRMVIPNALKPLTSFTKK